MCFVWHVDGQRYIFSRRFSFHFSLSIYRGRAAKLTRLAEIAKERAALEKEYDTLKELDPQVLADLEKELDLVTQAANRWTDNIFNCQSYLVKKRGREKKQVVGIPIFVVLMRCSGAFRGWVADICSVFIFVSIVCSALRTTLTIRKTKRRNRLCVSFGGLFSLTLNE